MEMNCITEQSVQRMDIPDCVKSSSEEHLRYVELPKRKVKITMAAESKIKQRGI